MWIAPGRRLYDFIPWSRLLSPLLVYELESLWRCRNADRVESLLLLAIPCHDLAPYVCSVVSLQRIKLIDVSVGVFVSHDPVGVLHRSEHHSAVPFDVNLVERRLL